uniref:Sorting nexin family member 21 n=1 Tax=Sphaeramia orbicularis TaxID=375764 RepID=A0A673A057_9TELE
MASRLLDRLKRSLFKDDQGVGPEQEVGGSGQEGEEFGEDYWEAELEEEEEESVTERLGGTLCFDAGGAVDEGADGEGSGADSDSDFLGESMEEGLSSTDTSPVGVSLVSPSPSSLLTQQFQESWRNLRQVTDSLMFEGDGRHSTLVHVVQSGGADKTPAVITRRYSDFQRLHVTLRRHHGDQMERKKLRRNFTAETIAKRSRAFEQYLSHLCSLGGLRGAPCVRHFFYLTDLQGGQLLIRVGRYQEALGPLLNAKRLQHKMGWDQAPPTASSHWLFTLVGLSCCFQEVDQLEEARDHCDHALRILTSTIPHPLLPALLRAVVRLSWQTGKDKRLWEELLQQLDEQGVGSDNQPTIKEYLVQHNLQDSEGEG